MFSKIDEQQASTKSIAENCRESEERKRERDERVKNVLNLA